MIWEVLRLCQESVGPICPSGDPPPKGFKRSLRIYNPQGLKLYRIDTAKL